MRLLLIIPYVLLVQAGDYIGASIAYIVALITDIDGTIARKIGATSAFGAIYDPVVDAIFMLTGFYLLVNEGHLVLWPVLLFLGVAVIRYVLSAIHYTQERRVQSTILSKTIGFSGFIGMLLGTMQAPHIVTTSVLVLGALANCLLTVTWLTQKRFSLRRSA